MAQKLITTFDQFNPSTISYGSVRTNTRGGKSIKVLDEKRNTLILSTPLILTWGINKMVDEKSGAVSYNIALQFPNKDYSNDSTRDFYEKIEQFEKDVLEACVQNSREWFGKPNMSMEVAKELFYPILKFPKDKETKEIDYTRSPTMKIKIPYWEGKFNIELYDTDKAKIFTPDMGVDSETFEGFIPKGSYVAGAIQCNGVWFTGGKFGVTWQLSQAIVRPPVRLQGGCFIDLSTDDKSTITTAEKREAEKAQQESGEDQDDEVVDTTNVADTDDEQEEEEDEPEPEPKQVIKKKRAVKKTVTKKTKA